MPSPHAAVAARLRALLVAILVAPLLLTASTAHAQGTSGSLPDPISGEDISGYAHKLDLSEPQRLAIDGYHEQYLVQFRELRDGDIAEFLETSGNVLRRFMFARESRDVEKSMGELDRLMGRIKVLDEGFFDRMQVVLSEEQATIMPRVRQMRERARYSSGLVRFIGFVNAGARVDLSAVVASVDLAPPDRAALEPIVDEYERRLTTLTRALHGEAQEMMVELVKRLEEATAAQEQGRFNPRMFETIREIWTEVGRDVMADATAISDLNRRTNRLFADVVAVDVARDLQERYYRRAYPDVASGAARSLDRYEAALTIPDLDDKLRDAIALAGNDLWDRLDRLAEQMIDVTERTRREGGFLRRGGGSGEDQDKLAALRKRRDEVNEQAIETLDAMLGARFAGALEDARRALEDLKGRDGEVAAITAGPGRRGGGRGAMPRRREAAPGTTDLGGRSGDPFLPPAISAAEVASITRMLALTEGEEAVLETLHEDYLSDYGLLRTERVEPVVELSRNLWSIDSESGEFAPPSTERIDELFELRRAAFSAIRDLDESFFDTVEIAVLAEDDEEALAAMPRVRTARQRVVYNHGDRAGGVTPGARRGRGGQFRGRFGVENREARIDLVGVLEADGYGAEWIAAVDPILAEYERQLVEALVQRYELALVNDAAQQRRNAERATRGRGNRGDRGGGGPRGGDETAQALRALDAAIVSLNRAGLERLAGSVDEPRAMLLRDRYRRLAHPDVYDDPRAVGGHFRSALALDDLTDEQRARVNEAFSAYRSPYAAACEEMVALRAEEQAESGASWENRDWQRMQERNNEMDRLRFSRTELNDKTLRRLVAILTEEQVARLGIVPAQ